MINYVKGGVKMDDSIIVDLYLKRDESAIAETQSKYGLRLREIIYKIVQNNDAMEECENDVYMESWNCIPPHEPRTYLFPFLAKIARHFSIDRIRKEKSKKRNAIIADISDEIEQLIPSHIDVEQIVESKIMVDQLNEGINQLAKYKRIIFVRRYFYMDTIEELSRKTGYSTSKIKSILLRCRKELFMYLNEKCGWE